MKHLLSVSLILFSLSACGDGGALQSWHGRWNGPEGTYLDIEPAGENYTVVVRDLDRERRFTGRHEGGMILFERDGKTETITPGNGQDTGMKWLADKKDCLVIQTGEGYCRD